MTRFVLLASMAAACGSSVYRCESTAQCARAGAPGTCIAIGAVGYCASGDSSCGSQLRWDDTAGDGLAGSCVSSDAALPVDARSGGPLDGADDAAARDAATLDAATLDAATLDAAGDGGQDAALADAAPDLVPQRGFVAQTCAVAGDIVGIWGSSASDIFAVSNQGGICHSTGNGQWNVMSFTGKSLQTVWGSAPNDVWAMGSQGVILHYTGTGAGFVAVGSPTTGEITSVFGCSATDVWAVAAGSSNEVLHFGQPTLKWTANTWLSPVGGVWCDAATSDVWLVGRSTVEHGVGGNFAMLTPPNTTNPRLYTVAGSSSSDVLMGGDNALWSSNGSSVVAQSIPANVTFASLWPLARGDYYAAASSGVYRYQAGSSLTKLAAPPGPFFSVWGSGAGDVYVGGTAGVIAHGK